MIRGEIINRCIKKNGYKSYLELGVFTGDTIGIINCERKIGVDMGLHYLSPHVTHKMSTDQFFQQNQEKFDCVFIDANHDAPYVCRDLVNSIRCLSEKGTIFLHDCFPPNFSYSASHLCGDCFKVIRSVVKNYSDSIKCLVFNTDYGVGMIKVIKPVQDIKYDNSYSWEEMHSNPSHVNLTSVSEVDIYV
jgi:hypothetical protein